VNKPILAGIIDITRLQDFLAMILADDPRLKDIPVFPEFKFQMDSELMLDCLWTLPKTAFSFTASGWTVNQLDEAAPRGLTGAGLLVEMPEGESTSNTVSGPPLKLVLNIVAMEERNTNLLDGTGTGIMAEQLAQLVLDILQNQQIAGYGCIVASPRCGPLPAHDWMALRPGIMCSRATLEIQVGGRTQTPRVPAPVALTFAGGNCTLTNPDGSAVIYYTTDGSPPVQSNTSATKYTGPFACPSQTKVLCSARVAGKILSEISGQTAP
jgi:hypothetical protein